MTRDDYMPMTAFLSPPDSLEEAEQRIERLSETSLTGLIGAVFLGMDQLRKALWEFGWRMKPTAICDGGRVKTWKATLDNAEGTAYLMILNEVGMSHCQVVNCKLAKAGSDVAPADLAAFKTVMEDET